MEASCSPSDGKEPEYDQYGGGRCQQMGFQNYIYNGGMVVDGGGGGSGGHDWTDQKANGIWEGTPLDFELEEFKQLISTNLCNNFSLDENKSTEERVMYY